MKEGMMMPSGSNYLNKKEPGNMEGSVALVEKRVINLREGNVSTSGKDNGSDTNDEAIVNNGTADSCKGCKTSKNLPWKVRHKAIGDGL